MHSQSTEQRYITRFPKSRALHEKARALFPRGCTHDARYILPFPIYITHARGSHKWDVDGNEYIDYYGGHGGLVLGHAHQSVVQAVNEQIGKGTQYGAESYLAPEWAELIKSYFPSADLVEFTNSGTEANMMAIRLARAFTGRSKVVKFRGHFHGGFDEATVGMSKPWDVPCSTGLFPGATDCTIALPINNEEALENALSKRDVAIVMVEALGDHSGVTGIAPCFYQTLRDLTKKYGTLLLFDEVVVGLRFPLGGAQGAKGIIPDLTALGKAINGMIPGAGCIVGHADVMNMLQFKDDDWNRYKRVPHSGTFNANPLCAAAGIATFKILATGEPQRKANEAASRLRQGMQQSIDRQGITGCAYGDISIWHLYFGGCEMQGSCERVICLNEDKVRPASIGKALALNLALSGIGVPGRGVDGFVSAVHTIEDIDKTIAAFDTSLSTMISEGVLQKG